MSFLDKFLNKVRASSNIQKISPEEAKSNLSKDKNIILLDVREDYEYKMGHIKGAKNLSISRVDHAITNVTKDKNAIIYIYCQSGARSSRACQALSNLGYTNIYNLGGISSWPYEVVK